MRTIAGRISGAKFVSANTISYVAITNFTDSTAGTDYTSEVVTLDLRSGNSKSIADTTGSIWDFSWSPDGTTLAYELQTAAGWQLWLKRGEATPVSVTRVMTNVRFEGRFGDGVWVTFSRSGTYLALANTFAAGPHVQVFRVSDGTQVWSATKGGSPFWWPGADRLYFEDFAGEHAWEASHPTVANVSPEGWIDPAQSPDGCCVAYTVAADTSPHIEIRDLQSGLTRKVAPTLVAHPVYASVGVVWLWQMAKSEALGVAPYQPTGLTLAYDLRNQRQVPLPFSGGPGQPSKLFDFWPH